jgi:predicted nucleic acid-binding protein
MKVFPFSTGDWLRLAHGILAFGSCHSLTLRILLLVPVMVWNRARSQSAGAIPCDGRIRDDVMTRLILSGIGSAWPPAPGGTWRRRGHWPEISWTESFRPDRFVSDSTLSSRVKAARRAIGDDGAAQQLIATVHGIGYRSSAMRLSRRRTGHSQPGRLLRRHATRKSASHRAILSGTTADPRHEFWPDDVPYTDVPTQGIVGHRQVIDAYLAQLARAHRSRLATFDQAMAKLHHDVAELVPDS